MQVNLNITRASVPVTRAECHELTPALWCVEVESTDPELELLAHTEGALVISPWGQGERVMVQCTPADPNSKFPSARYNTTITRHLGETHKYWLVKWWTRDLDWTLEQESAAFAEALRWIHERN